MITYLKEYWTIILFFSSIISYILGYIKAAGLFEAISFNAVPTDIYSPSVLLIMGVTFIVTSMITPVAMFFSLKLTNYCIQTYCSTRIQSWFSLERRIYFLGFFLTSSILFGFARYIPGGFAIIPFPIGKSVGVYIFWDLLYYLILLLLAWGIQGCFWSKKKDKGSDGILLIVILYGCYLCFLLN